MKINDLNPIYGNFSILAGKFLFSGQKNHFKASERDLIKKLPADIEKLPIYLGNHE